MTSSPSRRPLAAAALGLLTAALVPGLAQLPAIASSNAPAAAAAAAERIDADKVVTLGDTPLGLSDLDTRGRALPTSTQVKAAGSLDAIDLRWNQFGTPTSILPADGVLARATSSDPVSAARAWVIDNAAVFGLSADDLDEDSLELVSDQRLAQGGGHAVLFRQRFGDLTPALDSMVTVGVANGEIAYASSSLAKTTAAPEAATLTATEAWVKAAASVGRTSVDVGKITADVSDGWTRLAVPGFAQEQQSRLRALAMADGSVRPVFETNVVDVDQGVAFAYTLMVDAVTGEILHRQNQVEHSNDAFQYEGTITADQCGPMHKFKLTDNKTRQIDAVSVGSPSDDHVVKLFDPNGQVLVSGDLGTSPETATYSANPIPEGEYSAQVCPFQPPAAPVVLGPYTLVVTTSDTKGDNGSNLPQPRWRYFPSNPSLDYSPNRVAKGQKVGCWVRGKGCKVRTGPLESTYSFAPWDVTPSAGAPSFTSTGNNAQDREAWFSPLTPGGFAQAPVSPERRYLDRFTDAWNNSKCDPGSFTPGGNDIFAAVTNLFVAHNRMHDYSYSLGFTERNYNLQTDNMGRNSDPSRENDPEIGNVQAAAADSRVIDESGAVTGRNNANQVTLQDGIPGITNQYLFQPIAGAFYAPCADGAFDMSITGHEYTHAITNRMIGGPDGNISSDQGGAMGESWGDLIAAEYMFSHGYSTGASPWAVGPYATGNGKTGIRNFAINKNPLNYSDVGYDNNGPQVHADGEIWSGTMWSVRQAMVRNNNRKYPYSDGPLQRKCAETRATRGPRRAQLCPGNRQWVQLMFDSFLLQQGATSMLDARDAMIAAEKMRFESRNLKPMWRAFAQRGMGKGAKTKNADAIQPKPSFASPKGGNAKVKFRAPRGSKVYVGRYEARVTPVADSVKKTKLDNTVKMVAGRYQMLSVSKKHGTKRFTVKVRPGQNKTVRIRNPKNLAARANGAKVIGTSADSRNEGFLIDGTEDTNWGGVNEDGTNVDERNPFVSVDLAGKRHRISRVNVSAALTPPPGPSSPVPFVTNPDSGSRFTALRKFALERCVRKCASDDATWKRFFTSKKNAFPARRPRPVSPNLILRSFNVPNVRAAAIRIVALENQCTGFQGYAGEQEVDPTSPSDCKTGSDRGKIVHVSELHVY